MAALSWKEPDSGYPCVTCGDLISEPLARLGSVHCYDCRHGSRNPRFLERRSSNLWAPRYKSVLKSRKR